MTSSGHDGLHHAIRGGVRDPTKYFGEIKKVAVDDDQLSLAKELIKRKATKFVPEKFKDEYETALRELVDAKVKHAPIPREEPARKTAKVINLMDALRKSVRGDGAVGGKCEGFVFQALLRQARGRVLRW